MPALKETKIKANTGTTLNIASDGEITEDLLDQVDGVLPTNVVEMPKKPKKMPPWMVQKVDKLGVPVDGEYEYSAVVHGDLILKSFHGLHHVSETRGTYYIFDQKTGWRKFALSELKKVVVESFEFEGSNYYSRSRNTSVYEYVTAKIPQLAMSEDFNNIPLNLIPVQNGLYDWELDILHDFNKDIRHDWVYPFPYIKDATAPMFERFLDYIAPEEKNFIFESFGYAFYRATPFPLINFIFSAGGCGRSNLLDILSNMLRNRAVSVKLAKFSNENSRFDSSNLIGKEANIVPDDSGRAIVEFDEVKSITGGDSVNTEAKNQQQERHKLHAKFYHGFNNPPKMHDTTEAAKRRIYIMKLTRDVRPFFKNEAKGGGKIDYMEEASGIFNLFMSGLRYIMMINDEQRFTVTDEMNYNKKMWFGDNNDLLEFIEEFCVKIDDDLLGVWTAPFKAAYNHAMNKNVTTVKLKTELENLGYRIENENRTIKGTGKQKRGGIYGLKLGSEYQHYIN